MKFTLFFYSMKWATLGSIMRLIVCKEFNTNTFEEYWNRSYDDYLALEKQ